MTFTEIIADMKMQLKEQTMLAEYHTVTLTPEEWQIILRTLEKIDENL